MKIEQFDLFPLRISFKIPLQLATVAMVAELKQTPETFSKEKAR
jgi:hypothetical protein